jgi:hypothetical protein
VGPGFQAEISEPWNAPAGYYVFFRKNRSSVNNEQGIGIDLLVDTSEAEAVSDYQQFSDYATSQGYANLGGKVDLGDQASAWAATGLRKWGVNTEVLWRDRNVIVILRWDAYYSTDVSITDVLNLANLQESAIDADLASYQ